MNQPPDHSPAAYTEALTRLAAETSAAAEAASKAHRELMEEFAAREQLATVRTKLVRLFYLLDIEEETDDGRPFHPNTLGGSCRVLDAQEMNQILADLKDWAKTSTTTP